LKKSESDGISATRHRRTSPFYRDRPVPFTGPVRVWLWIPPLWDANAGM